MHLGFSTYTGMFVAPTGTLTIDPKNPSAAKVDITFPIAKVVTTATGLDEHLQNADFFDAAKYPTGRFVSTRVTIANQTAQIDGNLTLKGVTRPVTLDAQFVGARSEEHTSELQSLMRNSYAVFCLKKKKRKQHYHIDTDKS